MIYLDNAATTFPKPEAVYTEMDRFLRASCANPGRSGHRMAMESQKAVAQCRAAVASLLGAPSPDHVVFAHNGTDALNIAMMGTLRPNDHVVSTTMEHNSVIRPLNGLAARGVTTTFVEARGDGVVEASAILDAITPQTRMVAMTLVSNILGTVQPVVEVAEKLRATDTLLLVDAAQAAGAMAIDVSGMGIDYLAFAGHKGTLGPMGTGGLVIGSEVLPAPLREGGSGTDSESPKHPSELPERLEAGTLNVGGLVGLRAGVRYIAERGVGDIEEHERSLGEMLHLRLAEIPGVTVHGDNDFRHRTGIVSATLDGMDPPDVAAILDTSFGIATRPGLHCAPLAHRSVGTAPGGTVRLSPGPFTTEDEIREAASAISQIAGV